MLNSKTQRSFVPSGETHHLYRNTRSGELLVFMFSPENREWERIQSGTQRAMLVLRRDLIDKRNRENL